MRLPGHPIMTVPTFTKIAWQAPYTLNKKRDMRLYHGTNVLFKCFDLDFAARPDAASNGFLGVWLAKAPQLAKRFGAFALSVDVVSSSAYDMPIDELSKLHHACNKFLGDREAERVFYTTHRLNLIANGYDLINIVEVSGTVDMCIGLVPDNLTIVS